MTSGRHLVPEAHLAELLDPLLDALLGVNWLSSFNVSTSLGFSKPAASL
jgi:hypothetical protein